MFLELKYSYIGLCVPFIFVWFLFLIFSPNTRRRQLKLSLAKMPFGIAIDLFFFTDYWTPKSILSFQVGSVNILLESMLFAFFFGGIAAVAYQAIFRNKDKRNMEIKHSRLALHYFTFFFITIVLIMMGVNSIFATALGYGSSGIIMIFKREASLESALLTSAFMTVLLFSVYYFGRILIINTEDILRSWWFLYDTPLDIRFANVPITELLWVICYGFTAGARHNPIRKERPLSFKLNET